MSKNGQGNNETNQHKRIAMGGGESTQERRSSPPKDFACGGHVPYKEEVTAAHNKMKRGGFHKGVKHK